MPMIKSYPEVLLARARTERRLKDAFIKAQIESTYYRMKKGKPITHGTAVKVWNALDALKGRRATKRQLRPPSR